MDVPARFLPCLVAGLAYNLAKKYPQAADRVQLLKADYDEQWDMAADAAREKSVSVCFSGRVYLLSYASGKHAFGYCDRTGFRYPKKDLVPQIVNLRKTGLLVGRDVVDPDQPQLQLGRVRTNDPQALRNPRPDQSLDESRRQFAWNPVGGGVTELGSRTVALDISAQVGRVSVEVT
jgi:hypothetical protein